MSLPYSILIALHEESGTGYEIAQRFDQGMGYFWKSTHQQIYQTLSKMTDNGWLTFEEIAQQGKPDKKTYHATEQGMLALKKWLAQPIKPTAYKDALLMKIYAGPLTSPNILLAEVRRLQKEHEAQLITYKEIEKEWFKNIEQQAVQYQYIYLTLRNGIITLEAWLKWSEEVVDFLQQQI